MWEPAARGTETVYQYGKYISDMRQVETYESETGSSSDYNSVGFDGVGTGFKTAVVANRMAYVGNVKIENKQGNTTVHGDAVLKSRINKFDSFSLDRIIEASVNDGDSIVKLEAYADRLLIFKKNKMELVNISQEVEFLEDTFMHKGVSHPAATCKTDFGIAWINDQGCYLYDGQKVNNLLEKKGRQIIKESDWASFINDGSMIGYIPKKRQLVVVRDSREAFTLTGSINPAASTTVPGVNTLFLEELIVGDSIRVSGQTMEVASIESNTSLTVVSPFANNANDTSPECYPCGNIFLYDLVTQSWVKGDSTFTDDIPRTNFITDWNGDLVHAHSNGVVAKWSDTSTSSSSLSIKTKDIDFGNPGQKKTVYKVYISYKGDGSSTTVKYGINGETDSGDLYAFDSANLADKSSAENLESWHVATLVPGTASQAKNIYSFQIILGGTAGATFEINDITIVYRLKGMR